MRTIRILISGLGALMSLSLAHAKDGSGHASEAPNYFKEIVRPETATPTDVSVKNILELNASMFELYGNAAQVSRKTSWPST